MSRFINDFSILEIQYYNHYFFDKSHLFGGHRHNSWEINVVLEGEIEITYENLIFTLRKGEVFLGEPNSFHRNRITGDNTVEMVVIHFTCNDIPMLSVPRVFLLSSENQLLFNIAVSDLESFRKNSGTYEENVETSPYSFKKLLEVFVGRIIKENINLSCGNKKETIVYNKAVTYMKNNLHKSCSISEIAAECCVCNTTLKNIFKKYTGEGVNTFFTKMKLEYSKELLQQGNSIAYISEVLGFTSQAYFSQTFKKLYGFPPLKYKRNKV